MRVSSHVLMCVESIGAFWGIEHFTHEKLLLNLLAIEQTRIYNRCMRLLSVVVQQGNLLVIGGVNHAMFCGK